MADMDVRERILSTASDLFYREGGRAVGVDLIVEKAGVAKTSLYRYFPTKDDLIAAFLRREDEHFWKTWDEVARLHENDPRAQLRAQLTWIAERVRRVNYRGCPQLNMAAEFPAPDHPARLVAMDHKHELRLRLERLATSLGAREPKTLAAQLLLLINGAFVSSASIAADEAHDVLIGGGEALVTAALQRA